MSAKVCLADVAKLDMADRLMRVVKLGVSAELPMGTCRVIGWAFPNSNTRGDRWFDCHVEIERDNDSFLTGSRRFDHFVLTGTRYQVGLMLNREVRHVANEVAS